MGNIKDIYEILTDLFDRYQQGGFKARKKKTFESYIEKPYSLLQEVHSDYLKIFAELRDRVSSVNGISQDTINWLVKARAKAQVHRSELQDLDLEGVLDNFSRWPYRSTNTELEWGIIDFGESVNEYFAGGRGSHLTDFWSLLKCIVHLTQTAEEIVTQHSGLFGDPFDALDVCVSYLEKKIGVHEDEVADEVDKNIQLNRLLVECGLDPFAQIDFQQDARLMLQCGYSISVLRQKDKEFLDDLLYKIVSRKASFFGSDGLESKLIDKPADVTLDKVVSSMVRKLDQEETRRWVLYNKQREMMREAFSKRDFWVRPLQEYIDIRIEMLQQRLSKVRKSYRNTRKAFGL